MALANPLVISLLFMAAIAILLLFILPGRQRLIVMQARKKMNLRERMQKGLHAAGLFDQAPGIIFIGLTATTTVLALLFLNLIGWPGIILAVITVAFSWQMFLIMRQRQFMNRAHDELVPFLNRISTSVGAGTPAPTAYMNAVEESDALKEVLEDSAAKIASGERFELALLETLDILPLRMWAMFVRQVELYEELGGDAETTIQSTITQVNQMLQLQAEARSDFAAIVTQQRAIILILVLGIIGMFLILPNGTEMLITLLTTPIGIMGLVIGVSIIVLGIWGVNKVVRDIERKMSF